MSRLSASVALVLLAACSRPTPEKKAEQAAPAASASAATPATDSARGPAAPPPPGSGPPAASASADATGDGPALSTLLTVMPKSCPSGRLVVDVKGLAKAGFDPGVLDKFEPPGLAQGAGKGAAVMAALTQGGIELKRDLIAMTACLTGDDDGIIALGLDRSRVKGSLVGLLASSLKKGGLSPEVSDLAGTKALRIEKLRIAELKPGVLVLSQDDKSLAAAKEGGGAEGFSGGKGYLLHFARTEQGKAMSLGVKPDPKGVQAELEATMPPPYAAQIEKQPKKVLGQIETMLRGMERKLATSPLKDAVPVLKAVELSTDGPKLKARVTVTRAQLSAVVTGASQAKASELMRLGQ